MGILFQREACSKSAEKVHNLQKQFLDEKHQQDGSYWGCKAKVDQVSSRKVLYSAWRRPPMYSAQLYRIVTQIGVRCKSHVKCLDKEIFEKENEKA